MPVVRYFVFVGGILLGLLFFTDWYFPKAVAEAATEDVDRTIIRIQTSQRWPAAVRFDTSVPMPQIAPPTLASAGIQEFARVTPIHEAYAAVPPAPAKTADKPQRRARPVSRLSSRETRRRVAYQSSRFSETW
jgi:hypothetical protein